MVKQVLQPSMASMSQPQKGRTHTSFPEKIKRHKVQHGVLDVVDLFFKWELQREKTSVMTLNTCPDLSDQAVLLVSLRSENYSNKLQIGI